MLAENVCYNAAFRNCNFDDWKKLVSFKKSSVQETKLKMKCFFVLTFLILSCSSETQKHKCRLQFKYAKTCLFYNYEKPDCYPWDTTKCRISKRSHSEAKCPFYLCTVLICSKIGFKFQKILC